MSISQIIDRWTSRLGTLVGLYQIVPATLVGVVLGWASTGVGWIAALGPFGWMGSGLTGFVAYSVGSWMLAKGRLFRVEAKARERAFGESSQFDPMETIYRNKRLYLRDLAPLGRKRVQGKKFFNCEIIGPGTAIIGLDTNPSKSQSTMKSCNTHDVDCIEIGRERISNLAIGFWDCDFDGCDFYHMTLLFLSRSNEDLHWITPDFRQPILSSGQDDGK